MTARLKTCVVCGEPRARTTNEHGEPAHGRCVPGLKAQRARENERYKRKTREERLRKEKEQRQQQRLAQLVPAGLPYRTTIAANAPWPYPIRA